LTPHPRQSRYRLIKVYAVTFTLSLSRRCGGTVGKDRTTQDRAIHTDEVPA